MIKLYLVIHEDDISHMLHVWYIYLQNWVILGQMFVFQHHGAYGHNYNIITFISGVGNQLPGVAEPLRIVESQAGLNIPRIASQLLSQGSILFFIGLIVSLSLSPSIAIKSNSLIFPLPNHGAFQYLKWVLPSGNLTACY